MQQADATAHEVAALEAQAARAAQAGRLPEAIASWRRILEIAPRHAGALAGLGQLAFRNGDMEAARSAFQRLVEADGRDAQQWVNLALCCQALRDEKGEEDALTQALSVDPSDLLALILRGNLHERQGRKHEAARAYGAAATVAPSMERLHPDLRRSVAHAAAFKQRYDHELAAYLHDFLGPRLADLAGEDTRRFRDCVDIMTGRKRRYDSQPAIFYFPRLPAVEFLDRELFPWIGTLEAATDKVRAELLAVLREDAGFTPYVEYPPDVPHNQWAELNHSPRWSAFHLFNRGERVEANCVRCPETMALLATVPQPVLPGRTPNAMFSLLKPRTRIPPHTGVANVRLVAHLPLVVPPGCSFRVGNETRQWVPGEAFVFDDTIEHEARNDGEELRVVLIFDVWHPQLTAAERELLTAMTQGLQAFRGAVENYEL